MNQLTRREFVKRCGTATVGLWLAACGVGPEPAGTPASSNTPLPTSTSLPAATTISPAVTVTPLVAALATTQMALTPVPAHVVERLNSTLGMVGRPHFILYDGQWLDTGSMEWTPALTLHDALAHVSPALQDALRRAGSYFAENQRTNRQADWATVTEEFFAKEPPSVRAEFEVYKANMQRASTGNQIREAREAGIDVNALRKIRNTLRGEGLVAYLSGWVGFPTAIVVASTNDQFDILRIERVDAGNYGMGTEDVIAKLKFLDEKYGLDIIQAQDSSVEFILNRVPQGSESRELERWLLDFCPDLDVHPQDFAGGRISLWWD